MMTDKTIRQRIAEALQARGGPQMSWQEECDESDRQRGDFQEFESVAGLLEQIESGAPSIERSGEIDLGAMFANLAGDRTPADGAGPPANRPALPEPPKLEVSINFSREMIRDMAVDCILEQITNRRSGLVGMTILRHFGEDFFVGVASEYLAQILKAGDETPERDALPEVLVELHSGNEELIPRLADATSAIDRRAGDRLRAIILDALEDSYCRDELGFLATATLADRLNG